MPVLTSAVDPASAACQRNRAAQLAVLAQLDEQLAAARAGGGPRYAERHRSRGRLLVRERIELLLDRDAPFLELSSLAAWGTEFTVGASIVTGIGVVSGVECVIIGHDPTVRGGSMNPYTLRKNLRALEIARVNRLPLINLVESGGADLPTQSDLFVPAGQIFHDLTELSALGIPTIALVFGNSTAGGAYVPGMCDYAVLVDQQAKVFLGGPPLVKMATGEESDDEELGGAEMHSRVSGLADYFAADELDCIRHRPADRVRAELAQARARPAPRRPTRRSYDPDELLGIASADFRVPFDPREVLARVVDGSRFDEYKPLYGTSLVTGWAGVHGYPVGILANARGVLFSEEAKKAAEFILLANQTGTPLIFLQNTTGYMVGAGLRAGRDHQARRQDDQRGGEQHACRTSPSSWAPPTAPGNYGMCGRAYDPRFLFAWPNAKLGGDGRAAAGRGAVDRRPPGGRGRRAAVRRGRRTRPCGRPSRSRSSAESHSFLRDRPAVRRRDHRPPGHPHRARHGLSVSALRPGRGPPRLRRVPDVRAPHVPPITQAAGRQPGRDRAPASSAPPGRWTSPPWRCSPSPMRVRRMCAQADEAVPLPGSAPADTYLNADRAHRGRPAHRCGRRAPRLRLPVRERGVRHGVRQRRADLRRAAAAGHRGHGLEDRGQGADGRGRRPGAAVYRGSPATSRPARRTSTGSASRCWSKRRSAAAAGACGWCTPA